MFGRKGRRQKNNMAARRIASSLWVRRSPLLAPIAARFAYQPVDFHQYY
jgi:hypothetical protein